MASTCAPRCYIVVGLAPARGPFVPSTSKCKRVFDRLDSGAALAASALRRAVEPPAAGRRLDYCTRRLENRRAFRRRRHRRTARRRAPPQLPDVRGAPGAALAVGIAAGGDGHLRGRRRRRSTAPLPGRDSFGDHHGPQQARDAAVVGRRRRVGGVLGFPPPPSSGGVVSFSPRPPGAPRPWPRRRRPRACRRRPSAAAAAAAARRCVPRARERRRRPAS